MRVNRSYPGKLLLFGEYTVLNGSRALAIPMGKWKGRLKQGGTLPSQDLVEFGNYISQHRLFSSNQIAQYREAVDNGMFFESDIPQEYGVGSSGALCAALYDEFMNGRSDQKEALNVRKELAALENYFHGTSSGMDPLVSLLNTPVLRENEKYHCLSSMRWPEGLEVFLLDSGVRRSTGDLVRAYLAWAEDESFQLRCLRQLIQSVDHAISFLLDLHLDGFWEHVKTISALQYTFFKPMIADSIGQIWQTSLGSRDIAIKLCGAGGGGYYLGFARNSTDIRAACGEHLLISA